MEVEQFFVQQHDKLNTLNTVQKLVNADGIVLVATACLGVFAWIRQPWG